MAEKDSRELANFESQTRSAQPQPGDIPEIRGFDISGANIPYSGLTGGDHIIYLDFKRRYDLDGKIRNVLEDDRFSEKSKRRIVEKIRLLKTKGGLMIADVAGHFRTDFSFAVRLHDAFLISVLYEIEGRGDVTPNLFRKLNTRLYNSSSVDKYITLIYGEISEKGVFKFISAGHPFPLIYRRSMGDLRQIGGDGFSPSPPLAAFPSRGLDLEKNTDRIGFRSRFEVNRIQMEGPGDILVLFTDGLIEHRSPNGEPYFDPGDGGPLARALRRAHDRGAEEICREMREDLLRFGPPRDDVSFIVVKRKSD